VVKQRKVKLMETVPVKRQVPRQMVLLRHKALKTTLQYNYQTHLQTKQAIMRDLLQHVQTKMQQKP
jgi:hypothetical protein